LEREKNENGECVVRDTAFKRDFILSRGEKLSLGFTA
jgi:hypothetical protein